MKRYTLLYFIAALLFVSSCYKDEGIYDGYTPSLSARYLKLSATDLNFTASGAADTDTDNKIYVESITTPWRFFGMADWLTVSPESGDGSKSVLFSVTENPSAVNSRTSYFQFESTAPDFEYLKNITVHQAHQTPYITVSESSLAFAANGGSKTVTVDSNLDNYEVVWFASWLTIAFSSDTKSIIISADENQTTETRTTSIWLGDMEETMDVITVVQAAPSTPVPDTQALEFDNVGGKYSLSITSEVGWTATTSESWLQVSPESSEGGTHTLVVEALPNSSVKSRNGFVYINIGETQVLSISVSQKGLYIETEPTSLTFTAVASQQTIKVKSNTSWKVLSKPDWLTVSPQQGNEIADLTLSAPDYWDTSSRSGILKLGQEGTDLVSSVTVTQQGRTFDNLVAVLQFESIASSKTVDITTNGKWTAKTDFEWISVEPLSGTGNGTLKVSVTENTTDGARTGTVEVTVGSIKQTISVEQKGKYFTIDPTAFAELPSKGGTHSLHISTNESWTATSSSGWIALSQKSGTGDIDVTLTAPDNPSLKARQDITTFSPAHLQPIKVITRQAARYLHVDVTSISFFYKGGTSETITINTDATYTITASDSWMIIHQTDNTFTVEASENATGDHRDGKVIITMTGLNDGESYVLEIPVNQRGFKPGVDVDPYEENQQWDLATGEGFSITVTGFSNDKSWDSTANTGLTITVTTYDEDKQWD